MSNKQSQPLNVALGKNYDSEFCGSIPLHLVNLIQPHGILLVLDKVDLNIVQVSNNAPNLLSLPIEDLLEMPLARLLPANQFAEIKSKIETHTSHENIPVSLTIIVENRELALIALVHPKEEYILIELEETGFDPTENTFIGLYQQIKYITSLLKQAPNSREAAQIFVDELKRLTLFDRVLAYQFDLQWNGIVIAQAKEPEMDDYMDLRFPASDVPKQARDLYFKNPYRLIPARDYVPVGLNPVINPLIQRFTDLSDCNLRSVATVHLEYLANLNVMTSMSLPIIIDNKLWGLISCHNKTAKNPDYELRSAMELLSGIISAQLAAKEKEASYLLRVQLRNIHAGLLEQLFRPDSMADGLFASPATMLQLLNLSGAAVVYDGVVTMAGETPSEQEIKEITFWLRRNNVGNIYATHAFPAQYLRSQEYKEVASGLIALAINQEQGEYILGFRPEVLQTISWGGDPNQAIQMEPDGKTYHPRNSFVTYKETVKQTALAWDSEELEAANVLRSAVLEKIVRENY